MAVYLSPVFGAGQQLFNKIGSAPLAGGFVYTYQAGTTTPVATYTTSAGSTPNSNPIVLDGFGRFANEVWLTSGQAYKFVVTDSTGAAVGTYDNVSGVNDVSVNLSGSTGAAQVGWIQSGTGAVLRTVQDKLRDVINAVDFGVTANGSTDDTVALQNAINAAISRVARLILPPGTMLVSNLTINGEITIQGAGYTRSILQQKTAATGSIITVASCLHCVLTDFDIGGVATGAHGIALTGTTSGTQILNMLVVSTGQDGINISSTDNNTVIKNTIVESCARDGISLGANVVSASVENCRLNTNVRYSIYAAGNTTGPGHRLANNVIGGGQQGIYIQNQNHMTVIGNEITLQSGAGMKLEGVQYSSFLGNKCRSNLDGMSLIVGTQSCSYNSLVGNQCTYNTRRGIDCDTSVTGNSFTTNTIANNGESGIRLYKAGNNALNGNQVLNNGVTTAPKAGIYIDDAGTAASSNNVIECNYISDLGAGNQTYGIYMTGLPVNIIVTGNNFSATNPVTVAGGSILRARDNPGWVTQNQGNTTIASGSTTVTVTHGLAGTPQAKNILLVQSGASSNAPGELWITGLTSTQFVINCRNNPGVSGLPLEWSASLY